MKHLLLDCRKVGHLQALKRAEVLGPLVRVVLEEMGAKVVGLCTHQFQPHGATVLFLLAESHCSCHTFWEEEKMYLDLFSCSDFDHEKAVGLFLEKLEVSEYVVKVLDRPLQ